MKLIKTDIRDAVILIPEAFIDHRGFFCETYREDRFAKLGLDLHFVQDNHSRSEGAVMRGLHFQWEPPMGKVMRVTAGEAFLVAVDIRLGSPTLGKWVGTAASPANREQLWAPAGFARGFCSLTDIVEVQYKTTGTYNKENESGIKWDDPEIGIDWPISDPVLSDRDKNAKTLAEWLASDQAKNFRYRE